MYAYINREKALDDFDKENEKALADIEHIIKYHPDNEVIVEALENAKKAVAKDQQTYDDAIAQFDNLKTRSYVWPHYGDAIYEYKTLAKTFKDLAGFKSSEDFIDLCQKKIDEYTSLYHQEEEAINKKEAMKKRCGCLVF